MQEPFEQALQPLRIVAEALEGGRGVEALQPDVAPFPARLMGEEPVPVVPGALANVLTTFDSNLEGCP